MSLYPRGAEEKNVELTPKSKEFKLKKDTPKQLLGRNDARKKLTVRTGMYGVILTTGFDASGNPLEVLERIPANYNFDLPGTDNAVYQGEIWALSHAATSVAYVEYSVVVTEDDAEDDVVEDVEDDAEDDVVEDVVEDTVPGAQA